MKIKYINRNYLDFDSSEEFDLIIMITCDFYALSPAQRKKLLGNVAGAEYSESGDEFAVTAQKAI